MPRETSPLLTDIVLHRFGALRRAATCERQFRYCPKHVGSGVWIGSGNPEQQIGDRSIVAIAKRERSQNEIYDIRLFNHLHLESLAQFFYFLFKPGRKRHISSQ